MALDPVTWRDGPDLAALAAPIIAAHHPHLDGFPIRFVWRSRGRTIGKHADGSAAISGGTAEVVSERFAAFVMTDEEKRMATAAGCPGKMFWIEISKDWWEIISHAQRLALLDHEICHCGVAWPEEKDGPQMFMIRHTLEEFEDIVRRHGLWTPTLENMAAAML